MTLLQLWRQYSSQELLGETLREADPELFDQLNAAIEQATAREPLVQEVIRARLEEDRAGTADDMEAAHAASDALEKALTKLAEWKP